jgi:predicted nucleic acid binding AN1-type Zn finger protein
MSNALAGKPIKGATILLKKVVNHERSASHSCYEETKLTTNANKEAPKPAVKNKNACTMCQIKLSLLQMTTGKCRCENVYCMKHRMPENHECTYDFKLNGKEELKKQNPSVLRPKLEKI